MPMTRRQALAVAVSAVATPLARAMDPVRRPPVTPGSVRLALAAYSFNSRLKLDGKTPPTLTLAQFIDYAATQPVAAVELTSYYFAKSDLETVAGIKRHCSRLGLDISGSAVRNDFCLADAGKRRAAEAHVEAWLETTARLGGKSLRVFGGDVPKGDTLANARLRVIESLERVCDTAHKWGVYVALENHGGITAEAADLLRIVRDVKSEWLGVNLDTGNFRTDDPYGDLEKLAPYAVNVQVKTEVQRRGQKKEPADLARLVEMLKRAGYRGYVALEYEGAEDASVAVPRHLRELRELIGA